MTELVAGASAALLVAGLLLLLAGAVKVERRDDLAGPSSLDRSRRWWSRLSPRTRLHWALSLVAGLVVWVLTGWVVALAVAPVLLLGLPALLSEPPNRDLELLESLDRWVRGLSGSLPTGKSIPDAIRATASSAPAPIAQDVQLLVARMDDRWTTDGALRAFADRLDSPEADAIVAALILCTRRGGTGAAATLHELAASMHDRLRALREIQAERAKPRVVVRQVTVISVLMLVGAMVLSPNYFAPYATPLGQVLFGCLLAMFVLPMVALRRMTLPRRRERILRRFENAEQPETDSVRAVPASEVAHA